MVQTLLAIHDLMHKLANLMLSNCIEYVVLLQQAAECVQQPGSHPHTHMCTCFTV